VHSVELEMEQVYFYLIDYIGDSLGYKSKSFYLQQSFYARTTESTITKNPDTSLHRVKKKE